MDTNELDEFDSIESAGKINNDIVLSNVYNVKIGGFGKNGIKTYISSLTVSELLNDIQLYETLSTDKNWPVSQIIQREVDKNRVFNISNDYVLGKGRVVKYFPPIIVAILPKDSEGKINLVYDKLEKKPKESVPNFRELIFNQSNYRGNSKMKDIFLRSENLSLVKNLFLLKVSEVFDFNILCWDKTFYYAIVIDGQHRMDSLRLSFKTDPEIGNFVQDVVFLDVSDLFCKQDEKYSPVELVRRVFIDINTNAKRVGIVRQILMDDKDLASLFVQSLVDSVNKDGSDKLKSRYLRSEIVDWYGESLKHNLPYLTGILVLYQILNDYLIQYNLTSINDYRNSSKVTNWVKRLNQYFFVDKSISRFKEYENVEKLNDSFLKFVKEKEGSEISESDESDFIETAIFSYDYSVLEIAKKSFESNFVESLVYIFENLVPYKSTIEKLESLGGFDNTTLLNKALLSSSKKLSNSRKLKEAFISVKNELDTELNKEFQLLLTVLGQKTIFNIYFKRVFKVFNASFDNEKCLSITKIFVDEFNLLLLLFESNEMKPFGKKEKFILDIEDEELIELGSIATSFWEGIIFENGRIIYNNQGVSSFSSVIDFMLSLIQSIKKGEEKAPEFKIAYLSSRTTRIIEKTFGLGKPISEDLAERVIKEKKKFLIDLIKTTFKK